MSSGKNNTDKHQDKTEIIDLIFPVDSPEKNLTEILFIEKKGDEETRGKEKEDGTTNEEHEKQTEDENNNEEDYILRRLYIKKRKQI